MAKLFYKEIRRDITDRDFQILKFLWKWKIVSSQAIAKKFFANSRPESGQLRLRQLEEVGYLESIRIEKRDFAWQLNKRGYEFIRPYFSEDIHHGYKSHYPKHDFITTAFHLGEWLIKQPENSEVYAEQELRCNPDEFYPDWVPQSVVHRPDGYSRTVIDNKQVVLAFEAELSLKAKSRYEGLVYFYDQQVGIDYAIWLVGTKGMLSSIQRALQRYGCKNFSKHNFILLQDFMEHGWSAPILYGNLEGKTLNMLLMHNGVSSSSQWHHARDVSSLLDMRRTPKISITCTDVEVPPTADKGIQP